MKKAHIVIEAPVMEMDASEVSSLVKIDRGTLDDVTEGDDNPKFVISVINEQQSGHKINYDENAFRQIAEQVNQNQPTGYLGHIKDSDKDSAFPLPQVLWLASVVRKVAGKAQIITKGYLIPEGQARGLVKRRVINTVSWSGDAKLIPVKNGYDIQEFKLESIDFSRKNREGMKDQGLALVNEEMEDAPDDDKSKGGKKKLGDEDKTYEQTVAQLTVTEVKTHNAGLYRSIFEMGKEEQATEDATKLKVREDELGKEKDAAVAAVPEVNLVSQIKALLKLEDGEDLIENLTTLLSRLDKLGKEAIQAWFKADILEKKVPNEKARALIARLIPVTEMQGDYSSPEGIEKLKTKIASDFDEIMEKDEAIQMVISEMGSDRGGRRVGTTPPRNDNNGNPNEDDVAKKHGFKPSGNLTYEEVPL